MANVLCSTPVCSLIATNKPRVLAGNLPAGNFVQVNHAFHSSKTSKFPSLIVQATDDISNKTAKPMSIVCADCDGNGAVSCSQCKGTGVNSVDHFNGQFKAGGVCWLCRGKRDILCGNCNGAGFIGGFMNALDS